jgi:hypothetical protein
LGLLPKCQPQRILIATLTKRLFHILGQTVEPVGRSRPVNPLMRALMIIKVDPMIDPLTRVGERCEVCLFQKLPPDRLPEPLDLAQRHRVVRGTAYVRDPLLFEHPLKTRLTAPGDKLPPIVAEDLSRRAPLPDRPFEHLEHRIGTLLAEQSPAYQEARVVVDDPDQVHAVHTFELEGEDIDLPQRIR